MDCLRFRLCRVACMHFPASPTSRHPSVFQPSGLEAFVSARNHEPCIFPFPLHPFAFVLDLSTLRTLESSKHHQEADGGCQQYLEKAILLLAASCCKVLPGLLVRQGALRSALKRELCPNVAPLHRARRQRSSGLSHLPGRMTHPVVSSLWDCLDQVPARCGWKSSGIPATMPNRELRPRI